uniref:Tpc70 protein n=1 Tax=Tradescantia paludosa TaxID=29658 RepID=Q41615_9LILI|nr:tpc70 protein [Tradescantia paludosa]
MADTKMTVVALLLISMLKASSFPSVPALCLDDCIARCSNGKNLDSCTNMCNMACIIPTTLPDGTDPATIITGK